MTQTDVDAWIEFAASDNSQLHRLFAAGDDTRQQVYDFTKGFPLAIGRVLSLLAQQTPPIDQIDPHLLRSSTPGIMADVVRGLPLGEDDLKILRALMPFDAASDLGAVKRATSLEEGALSQITARLDEWCVIETRASGEIELSPFARLALE